MNVLANATSKGSVGSARQVRRATATGSRPVLSARPAIRLLFASSEHDTQAEHLGTFREWSGGLQSDPNEMSQGAASWKP
jgi:hypothetical protein